MKSFILIALLGFVSLSIASNGPAQRYDGYQMYNIKVDTPEQLAQVKKLGNNIPVNFLNDNGGAQRSFDVVVDPEHQIQFEDLLDYNELAYEVAIPDLQKVIEDSLPRAAATELEWTQYHSYETISKWVDSVGKRYPFTVRTYNIGKSYENRTIRALKISHKPGNKAIFLDSSIHAIEWISSAAGTCFINQLLTSKDERIRQLALNYDWIYVPVVNPDGLEYSRNVQRLWRKNTRPTGFSNSSGPCLGVDMNRNFDSHWGVNGWNMDVPCDHWYAGSKPNSEPEIQVLQKFINQLTKLNRDYIRMYAALHSYGNLVVLPFGHTNTVQPPNIDQMKRISKGFADSAEAKHGTKFNYGPSGEILYFVSGSAKDWAYEKKGIPFTATIELRDDKYGFFLPANQIIPVCEELTEGFIGMIKAAAEEQYFDNKITNCELRSMID